VLDAACPVLAGWAGFFTKLLSEQNLETSRQAREEQDIHSGVTRHPRDLTINF
jgi:hypothetical protein